MNTLRPIKFIFILGIFFFNLDCFSQENKDVQEDSLAIYKFTAGGDSLSLILLPCDGCRGNRLSLITPCGRYETISDYYEEGFLFTVLYSDSSYIVVLCGSMATLSLSSEMDAKLFSRKTSVSGHTIIYENVKPDKLCIFNKAFDLMNPE